jgi:hypothetical protein
MKTCLIVIRPDETCGHATFPSCFQFMFTFAFLVYLLPVSRLSYRHTCQPSGFSNFRGLSVRIKMRWNQLTLLLLECVVSSHFTKRDFIRICCLEIKSPVRGWLTRNQGERLFKQDVLYCCVAAWQTLVSGARNADLYTAVRTFGQWTQESRLKDSQSPTYRDF